MVLASERNTIDEEAAVNAGTLSQFLGGKLRAKEEQKCALEAPREGPQCVIPPVLCALGQLPLWFYITAGKTHRIAHRLGCVVIPKEGKPSSCLFCTTHNIQHGHGPGARSQEPKAQVEFVFETHGGIPVRIEERPPKKTKKRRQKKKPGKKKSFLFFCPCCLLNQMAQRRLVLRFLQMSTYTSSSRVALMISKNCSAG
jgi:hypothetical protein